MKGIENNMIDEKKELKTAGILPAGQMEENTVLLCMAMILKVLFDMESYVRQVMTVYYFLYSDLNVYEILEMLVKDWKLDRIKLKNVDNKCYLIIFNDEKLLLIEKEKGQIFYTNWIKCGTNLPKVNGKYPVMVLHLGYITDLSYQPEFADKGWNHYFDDDGIEYYIEVEKWCSFDNLQLFNPSSSTEVSLYDNK